jgi:hypothetical protein
MAGSETTEPPKATTYAGAGWLQQQLPYWDKQRKGKAAKQGPTVPSALGLTVADILGHVFGGLYHLDTSDLMAAEWDRDGSVAVRLSVRELATIDSAELTMLVVLCSACGVRLAVQSHAFRSLRLLFSTNVDGQGRPLTMYWGVLRPIEQAAPGICADASYVIDAARDRLAVVAPQVAP